MPNIDTSVIQGFDGMTAEQKLEAVLKLDIPEKVDMSKFVSKEVFDKKASEAATLSKQLKENSKETELSAAMERIKELEKTNTINAYTNSYLSLGYDKDLAAETAKAMAEGDMETVFKNGEKHKTAMEAKIKADLMNKTPKPDGSGGEKAKEDAAVAKAKELAKARFCDTKSYTDILNHYAR